MRGGGVKRYKGPAMSTPTPSPQGSLPACGLYRTTVPIGGVPAGQLVSFHNHGTPGPGVYVPQRWDHNVAVFSTSGVTLPDPALAATLVPLRSQGFYRVTRAFHCCPKKCRQFDEELLVQLGYNGAAQPLLFVVELGAAGLHAPLQGSAVDEGVLANLAPLKVARTQANNGLTPDQMMH